MKQNLLVILVLMQFEVLSQRSVNGVVVNNEGKAFPGVQVIEIGTENETLTNEDGGFELVTTQDSCAISFVSWQIDAIETVNVISDTTLNIELVFIDYYNTRWMSFGTNYGTVNRVFGFQIGNGADEEPLIHFEDFRDKILIQLHAQTDFESNHSYGGEFGFYLLRYVGRTTVKYHKINFENSELRLTDFNLTSRIRYFKNTGLVFRTGYQSLNDVGNYGIGLGLEQGSRRFHFGLNSRYYSDYFHHEVYLQIVISNNNLLTFRTVYNRIYRTDLLTAGLNYAIVRAEK